jgi:hypothetical protein
VAQWLRSFGVTEDAIAAARQESLVWALERGSRSGRVAYQFANWAGLCAGPSGADAPADAGVSDERIGGRHRRRRAITRRGGGRADRCRTGSASC